MLSELLKVQLNSDLIRLICFINYLIVLSSLKQKTISGVLWSCVEPVSYTHLIKMFFNIIISFNNRTDRNRITQTSGMIHLQTFRIGFRHSGSTQYGTSPGYKLSLIHILNPCGITFMLFSSFNQR